MLQKIRDRMKKISKRVNVGNLLKRKEELPEKEDVQPSLEATLVQKAQAAGKELDEFQQEYVRLQFERNSLRRQYPKSSDRNKEIVKQIRDLENLVQKFGKGRPKDDPLLLPFKQTTTMTTAEKKAASRVAKTIEEKQKELESNRNRKALKRQSKHDCI